MSTFLSVSWTLSKSDVPKSEEYHVSALRGGDVRAWLQKTEIRGLDQNYIVLVSDNYREMTRFTLVVYSYIVGMYIL